MTTPRFSILVPTRDRPETLGYTLDSVLSQPGDDFEVVVADNAGGPDTMKLIEARKCAKLKHVRSEQILPMAENWERALDVSTGEYVTVLGDDDALVPTGLQIARRIVDHMRPEILSWRTHTYWWPNTIVPWNRNHLVLMIGDQVTEVSSRSVLEQFYDGVIPFSALPMIYNAFFHRDLIDEARLRHDALFVPRDTAPDVASAILGLHMTERYVQCARPLSIRGNSGKSTGTAQWARSLGAQQRDVYLRDERLRLRELIHPSLVASPNLQIIVASVKLKCRDLLFPGDTRLAVDLQKLLRSLIENVNYEPEAYEENVADIRMFAEMIGAPPDTLNIPPRQIPDRREQWGPHLVPGDPVLIVNCQIAGIADIAGAARLVEAILAPLAK